MGSFLIRLLLSSNLQRQTLLEKYLLWIILEDRLYGGVNPLEHTASRNEESKHFFLSLFFFSYSFHSLSFLCSKSPVADTGVFESRNAKGIDVWSRWHTVELILHLKHVWAAWSPRYTAKQMCYVKKWYLKISLRGQIKRKWQGSLFYPSGFRGWTYSRELTQLHDDSSTERPRQLFKVTTRWFLYRTNLRILHTLAILRTKFWVFQILSRKLN